MDANAGMVMVRRIETMNLLCYRVLEGAQGHSANGHSAIATFGRQIFIHSGKHSAIHTYVCMAVKLPFADKISFGLVFVGLMSCR